MKTNLLPADNESLWFRLFLTSLILFSFFVMVSGQGEFITTWQTTTPNESITIPTHVNPTYNFDVDWGDGNVTTGHTGDATHTFALAGTYTVEVTGMFPRIFFNGGGDKDKIMSIDQWGSQKWESMCRAFRGCSNLVGLATDTPDLSLVIDMDNMFDDASSFNQDIGNWDVSNVIRMTSLFAGASSFNQDISSWDVSNVWLFAYMFDGATLFNQDIGGWDMSSATNLTGMFLDATSFNQDISGWDVSSVTMMPFMFTNADAFDQPIGSWNTSSVTDLYGLFLGADVFNQDISGWDVSGVTSFSSVFDSAVLFDQDISGWDVSSSTSMASMFGFASAFNQDIGSWDVSNVTDMEYMFWEATSFNQDISGWDVSNVTTMDDMFEGAILFDQNLGTWDVSNVTTMNLMFYGVTLSTANYDALLMGWDAQTLQPNVTFDGGNSLYCAGASARANMIASDNWTITDGGLDPAGCGPSPAEFVTTWQTTTANESITIPTFNGETYMYDVDWGDGNVTTGHTGDATHTYTVAGTYQVSISGSFPRIYFNGSGNKDKIISIDQWGNQVWTSMNSAFKGCINLAGQASDTPDLSVCTDLFAMFMQASSFNQDIGNWDISNIIIMNEMFRLALNFNQDIGSWNTGNVTNMRLMFDAATSFNQDIGNWDVSKVTDITQMFKGASVFNQDIGAWDVSSVTKMERVFENASAFNQDIGNWDVSNVFTMYTMFRNATSFDQNLGNWDVSSVIDMSSMLQGTTLSTANYDALLIGWNSLNLKPNVTFHGGNAKYCIGEVAKSNMIASDNWTITDAGLEDPSCLTCSRIVTNTNDAGTGSLREAITCANNEAGADTITFDIPGVGPHVIELLSTITVDGDSTVIDATTQPGNYPMDGKVILDITNITGSNNILAIINGANSEIYGLSFRNNYLGGVSTALFYFTTADYFTLGDSARGNWFIEDKWTSSVFLKENIDSFTIQSNVFQSDSLRITHGITVNSGSNAGLIGGDSVWHKNYFFDLLGTAVELRNSSDNNKIVGNHFEECNIAIYNNADLFGGFNQGNIYLHNTFVCNTASIVHDPSANNNIVPPLIEYSKVNFVAGTASPNSLVELYYSPDTCMGISGCQGEMSLGIDSTGVDGQFYFSFDKSNLLSLGYQVSAIQTDTLLNGSSAFSTCTAIDSNCVDFVYSCEDGIIGSIRSAIDCAASGDTIYFLSILMGEHLLLDNNVVVDKDVSVFGLGNPGMVILSNPIDFTIQINPNKEVHLKDLSLCVNSGATSIVENFGDLTLENITITDKRSGQPLPLIVNHPLSSLDIDGLVQILKQ